MTTLPAPAAAAGVRRPADKAMRRVLRIDDAARPRRSAGAHRAFSAALLVSAARCLLTYVVLPFVAPAVGLAAGVGPWVGLPLGAVAVASNVVSIRRFWLADHRWRWAYTALGVSVIVLVVALMAGDVADLLR